MSDNQTLTTAEIKKRNCEKIFNYIYNNKRTSKQTIAQTLSLSLPTVSQNLKLLEEQGFIIRSGFYESTGGRKAQIIHCVEDARIAIGAAVLKERIHLGAIDLFGNIIKDVTISLPFQNTSSYYREFGRFICRLADELPYDKEHILGVGIAIQGLVSPDGETVVYGIILQNDNSSRQNFQQYIPFPCRLLHDTEAAAAAEFWKNDAITDAVYLVLNQNMGGALITGGRLHHGSGIVEHMTLVPDGKPCYCGKNGCVEAYCSANSLRQESGLPLELFFQQLRANDSRCVSVWTQYLRSLALAIDNIRMLVDCQFMIGGLLQQYMIPEDFDLLAQYIYEQSSFPKFPVSFIQSRYGHKASMIGAALSYIDSFLKHIHA